MEWCPQRQLTGMCGNFDTDADNDMATAQGVPVADVQAGHDSIGDSYVVSSDPEEAELR